MLVFVDESGDSGFKLGRGSSTHFVVTAVCFSDRDAARACEVAIGEYRRANGLPERFEFHFSRTPADLSLGLLHTAAAFDFSFVAVAVEKAAAAPGSPTGNDLHVELIGRALRLLPGLANATVAIDGKRPKPLQSRIERRLKLMNAGAAGRPIRKVKFGRSEGDDLLQLADAVSGAIFLSLTKKDESFRTVVRRQEQGLWFGL